MTTHAFRLGPVSAATPPSFAYAALLPGGKLELCFAPGDPQGLAALRDALNGHAFTCEPPLAEAAGHLGLEVGPLPPDAVEARALLAFELASGVDHGASRPEAIRAFLDAAGRFWSSKAWELIPPEEQLHVAFTAGRSLSQGELAIHGGDPARPRLVLCDEAEALARLAGKAGDERLAELVRGAGLTIELAPEPAWAGAAIEVAFRMPRLPVAERRRAGVVARFTTQDLVIAAALLQGVVAFADGDGSEVEVEADAAQLRVRAHVGPTPPDASSLQPDDDGAKLTPVVAEGAGVEPAESVEEDRPLSPEELAAMLKGGEEIHPLPPQRGGRGQGEGGEEPAGTSISTATGTSTSSSTSIAEAPPPAPSPRPSPPLREGEGGPGAAPSPRPSPPLRGGEGEPGAAPSPRPSPPLRGGEGGPGRPRPGAVDPRRHPDGFLTRAWRALGGGAKAPAAKPAPAAPPKPARPPPASRPAAPPTPPPPEEPPDPAGPFGRFARALKVDIPPEPHLLLSGDRERVEGLARQLAAGAAGREHFVSFPAVAVQIIELVHSPDADARGVAGFISRDPGLAADVLAVANSAAFRGVSEAASVREAVARLGLQEVGRVASAVSARTLLVPAHAGGGAPSTQLFSRAVAVATAASATALRVRGAHSDRVWLAGLLHDVGLALGAAELHRLGAAAGPGLSSALAERALEQAHVELGAAALRAWGLPQYLGDICARHHDDEVPAAPDLVDLHLVRLASALARLAEPEVGARAAREIVQSARALGFDVHAVRALATDLRAAEARASSLVR